MVAETFARTITRFVGDAMDCATDTELIRRYAASGDHGAFAILVRRHGPMVFGVCRRMLGHVQDAEDAFQATFLVLARRAHAVRSGEVSRFLYGVAVRIAVKARIRRARQLIRQGILIDEPVAPDSPEPADWLPLLDSALSRLPERDRWPIILCDVQGRSRSEAAAELGIAEGTLSSRLARSRAKLRARLLRLGVAPSLAALATGLAPQTVPARTIELTLAAEVPAAAARELAEGVLRSMFLVKTIKIVAVGLLAFSALTFGMVQAPGNGADPPPAAPKSSPQKDAPRSPAKSDAQRFRGDWVIEAVRRDGWGDEPANLMWVGESISFDGEHVKFMRFPGRQKLYKLDPGWDQKRIDFEFREVQEPTQRVTQHVPAIYRFEDDKLHIVLGVFNLEDRPDSFEHLAKGPPFTHIVLRRAPDERKEVISEEQKALDGTWIMTAIEANGERKAVSGAKLDFKGIHFTIRHTNDDPPTEGTYKVDATATPRQIDLTIAADGKSGFKGKTIPGIYKLEAGVLILALDEVGNGRPKNLTESDQPPVMYFVRDGTETPLPPPRVVESKIRELQKARVVALGAQIQGGFERVKIGKDSLRNYLDLFRDLAEAKIELAENREAKIAAAQESLRQLLVVSEQIEALYKAGLQTKDEVLFATIARLKAEIELEKLKAAK
jgi:RNA polymerase sigma factor (sigma-70 family)